MTDARRRAVAVALAPAWVSLAVLAISAAPATARSADCAALAGAVVAPSAIRLPTRGARVLTAVSRPAEGTPGTPNYLPAYCEVRGTIAPVDVAAPVINFGMALPLAWNGNAIQIGGNGLLGFVPWLAALNRNGAGSPQGPTFRPDRPYPLAQGYVTYGDDSGHSNGTGMPPGQPGGVPPTTGQATMGGPPPMGSFEWVANREAWLNFSYEHIRKAHDAALAVVDRFYGRVPAVSYFMGESHGGREAMEAVARYPEDYQGALISVPLAYLTELWQRDFRNLRALASPGTYIPASKTAAIERQVVAACDVLDGKRDGVVNNYAACDEHFDPSLHPHAVDALRCAGGSDTGDDCLSDLQLATLNTLRAPTPLSYRVAGLGSVFPASPAGSESHLWLNGRGPPRAGDFNPAEAIMRVVLHDPQLSATDFDSAAHRDGLARMSAELDPPTNWSRFFKLGGKVVYHSAANDYLTNARSHVAAYQAVLDQSGPLASVNLRFYVTPGGDHGSRSYSFPKNMPQPRLVDLIGTLEGWVERGQAPPETLPQFSMATTTPYTITAMRPLCQYPRYPRWTGQAATGASAGYACTMP